MIQYLTDTSVELLKKMIMMMMMMMMMMMAIIIIIIIVIAVIIGGQKQKKAPKIFVQTTRNIPKLFIIANPRTRNGKQRRER